MSRSYLSHSLTLSAFIFFFNATATTEIYTLSLHDALPISMGLLGWIVVGFVAGALARPVTGGGWQLGRSEEHTSELQSRPHLVCRLLLEKKKTIYAWTLALAAIAILVLGVALTRFPFLPAI